MTAKSNGQSVVIIGAGVVGVACAHYLAADGYRVTVVDKGTIGGACSYGNCGHVIPSHILPLNTPGAMKNALASLIDRTAPFRVKPELNLGFARWMVHFARLCSRNAIMEGASRLKPILDSAFAEYEALYEAGVIDGGWRQSGLLYVFQSVAAFEAFAETNAMLSDHFGVSASAVEGEALPEFDPVLNPGLAGGFFYEKDALVRPDQLTGDWALRLREAGVSFIEHCNVGSLEIVGGRVRALETTHGRMEGDAVVIAAGALSGDFAKVLGCRIPLLPGKGYSITVPHPDPCPRSMMLLPERHVAVTPFDNGLRIGSMMEFVGYDNAIPDFRIEQLKTSVTPYFRTGAPTTHHEAWCGWRPMTWDSLPIIGRAPGLENTVLATGHGMMGVMLAPATGRLVAEILGERPRHIPDAPYAPARFSSRGAHTTH